MKLWACWEDVPLGSKDVTTAQVDFFLGLNASDHLSHIHFGFGQNFWLAFFHGHQLKGAILLAPFFFGLIKTGQSLELVIHLDDISRGFILIYRLIYSSK